MEKPKFFKSLSNEGRKKWKGVVHSSESFSKIRKLHFSPTSAQNKTWKASRRVGILLWFLKKAGQLKGVQTVKELTWLKKFAFMMSLASCNAWITTYIVTS